LPQPPENTRGQWKSHAGFILAAVGSAVGLGNMWRFPYITADRGGAAFVILYILMVFVVGVPMMLSEFAVGRRTRLSPISALRSLGGRRLVWLGYMYVLTGCLILAYYSVIAGWTLRYTLKALVQGFAGDPSAFFTQASSGFDAVLFHVLFMGITISIVVGGVKKGIERASLVLMPVLFLLIVGLAVWAVFLQGSGSGYSFYLRPDASRVLSTDTLSAAAGQAFFSLSLGMGAMLTYSSYLSRDDDLPTSAVMISASDFGVAFFAGLVVFPVIFAFGLQQEIGESTVGALFISLPRGFIEMGAAGRFVGFLFFAALFVGALTSAISLLEVVTSSLIDTWKIQRRRAALGAGIAILVVGLPSAFSLNALGLFDKIAGEFLLVVGAFVLALYVGWRMPDPVGELALGFRRPRLLKGWYWIVRVVAPIVLAVVIYEVGKSAVSLVRDTLF
jgi:NSS family neurotransmitter:Na+ symporter